MKAQEISPRFAPGQRVQIRPVAPVGHCRTPSYARGATGRVEAVLGDYRNPEDLAYGGAGLPASTLYWIRLTMADLFEPYDGPRSDTLLVEVYEHWLLAAQPESVAHGG